MGMITTRSPRVTEIQREKKIKKQDRESLAYQKNWADLRRGSKLPSPYNYNTGVSAIGEIQDGMWAGQRCFIIGGGPSLKDFDFSKLQAERTIAINRAFEHIDPSIIFWADHVGFYSWLITGKLGKEAQETFSLRAGKKVALNPSNYDYPESIQTIPAAGKYLITKSLLDGLGFGDNSGYAALNLAVCLGANPIYLLGFDMKGTSKGRQDWFHDGYPETSSSESYVNFCYSFDKARPELKKMGIQVFNLNKESHLLAFPFRTLRGIRPALKKPNPKKSLANPLKKEWLVISYYTEGTSYEKEVEKLIASLKERKLPYQIYAHKPMGSWRANLNHKSACILKALETYKNKDIVFIDSDAIVRKDPVLFDALSSQHEYDIAATFHKYAPQSGDPDELLSGTLWMQNHEMTRAIIRRWHKTGIARPTVRHQRCLKITLQEMEEEKIPVRVYRMPFEYTSIFDYARHREAEPVIEHFQASRRFRAEVGYGGQLIT